MSKQAHLPSVMADQLGISRSEARRVIATGGVWRFEGVVHPNDRWVITEPDVPADGAKYIVGETRYVVVPSE